MHPRQIDSLLARLEMTHLIGAVTLAGEVIDIGEPRNPDGKAAAALIRELLADRARLVDRMNMQFPHHRYHTKAPWTVVRYGYEKHAIIDDRGTEVAFVPRLADADRIVACVNACEEGSD